MAIEVWRTCHHHYQSRYHMPDANLAERLPAEIIERQAELFTSELIHTLLGAVFDSVFIVNICRQVVFANRVALAGLGVQNQDDVLGLCPGELFDCGHALGASGGCGTTEFCQQCGAFRAIGKGLEGVECEDECRIMRHHGKELEASDLRVRATPFFTSDEKFVIIAFNDISHEKRRRALERIFFHDILNTAGGLRGFVEMLMQDSPENLREDTAMLYRFFSTLLEEIKAHKTLMAAENDELEVREQLLHSRPLLETLVAMFKEHDVARGKTVCVASDAQDIALLTDVALLHRILANLLKNALEASERGQTVAIDCQKKDADKIVFSVQNEGVMSKDTQVQLFKRSFSTKGEGRGLGTYSVRLLTERYLQGKADFISNEKQGTIFYIELPLKEF